MAFYSRWQALEPASMLGKWLVKHRSTGLTLAHEILALSAYSTIVDHGAMRPFLSARQHYAGITVPFIYC